MVLLRALLSEHIRTDLLALALSLTLSVLLSHPLSLFNTMILYILIISVFLVWLLPHEKNSHTHFVMKAQRLKKCFCTFYTPRPEIYFPLRYKKCAESEKGHKDPQEITNNGSASKSMCGRERGGIKCDFAAHIAKLPIFLDLFPPHYIFKLEKFNQLNAIFLPLIVLDDFAPSPHPQSVYRLGVTDPSFSLHIAILTTSRYVSFPLKTTVNTRHTFLNNDCQRISAKLNLCICSSN